MTTLWVLKQRGMSSRGKGSDEASQARIARPLWCWTWHLRGRGLGEKMVYCLETTRLTHMRLSFSLVKQEMNESPAPPTMLPANTLWLWSSEVPESTALHPRMNPSAVSWRCLPSNGDSAQVPKVRSTFQAPRENTMGVLDNQVSRGLRIHILSSDNC